jgi:hypothetical protein
MYKDATAAIFVNGEKMESFHLQRSVRQGCPFAPYLYILAAEALAYMLEDPIYGVQGLTLPDGRTVTSAAFVDDCSLFLEGSTENLDRAAAVLQVYCLASGAFINLGKTTALWASLHPRIGNWGHQMGLRWLANGEQVRYLGAPVGVNLHQKTKDEYALTKLSSKLQFWGTKHLSLIGRILISNQVLLASLWYLCSYTDLSHGVLTKAKALVRNFIWLGRADHIARAKVRWDELILPTSCGGMKVLDPILQAAVLLAKLLVRGLTPGYAAWKSLIIHRIRTIRLVKRGTWPPHSNWLMTAIKIRKGGSPLWNAIWRSWCLVRSGVEHKLPEKWTEILRQPLFGNSHLQNPRGQTLVTEDKTSFLLWANKGFITIVDIWNQATNSWSSPNHIKSVIRSPLIEQQLHLIISAVPWSMQPNISIKVGDWIAHAADPRPTVILQVLTILETTFISQPLGRSLEDPTNLNLLTASPIELPFFLVKEVRILSRKGDTGDFLDFNPLPPHDPSTTFWIYAEGFLSNL